MLSPALCAGDACTAYQKYWTSTNIHHTTVTVAMRNYHLQLKCNIILLHVAIALSHIQDSARQCENLASVRSISIKATQSQKKYEYTIAGCEMFITCETTLELKRTITDCTDKLKQINTATEMEDWPVSTIGAPVMQDAVIRFFIGSLCNLK